MMYCAECGTKMTRHDHGAWVICCNGWGYWYSKPPTNEDLRHYGWPTSVSLSFWPDNIKPFDIPTFWLYKTAKWPSTRKATWPKLED